MGMSDDAIDEALGANEDDEEFAVWSDNERSLNAFLAVRRMWRHAPMGGVLGLDRPSVESELRMRKIKVDAALLDDLDAIEGGALEVLNAK